MASPSATSTGNASNPSTPLRKNRQPPSPANGGITPHAQLDPASQACDIAKASLAVSILLTLLKYLKVSGEFEINSQK